MKALSQLAASSRPFTPPVHALVLPTQIPTDLLLTFRDLDEVLVVRILPDLIILPRYQRPPSE